ncbi:DUF736 family protein [Aminobacter aganoensis]|uniref:Uncharacterized protein (DUF736 family) n=1 Tax=Aminobacter aganoensis TaxID=83264 RepID=A0A7X0KM36_9HYPH|nr:DUF736 family protein [Aminobacter aganoensis]MBB6355722.1 uncharacterized protein (DUF736 family) [Aminobacter aganoensis]
MTVHLIHALLSGTIDPDIELQIALKLPMTLRRVERTDDHAPDYRIDSGDRVDFGYGWTMLSAKERIPYIAILIEHPAGKRISGVAWQSPEFPGRWSAQLHRITEISLNA